MLSHIHKSLCLGSLCLLATLSAPASDRDIEAEVRREALRQLQSREAPPSVEQSLADAAAHAAGASTLHIDAPDPAAVRALRQTESRQEASSGNDQRNWLLTGVLKLQGRYEETLSDEERRTRDERRRRYAEPPLFIDRLAEHRERQREQTALQGPGENDPALRELNQELLFDEPDNYLRTFDPFQLDTPDLFAPHTSALSRPGHSRIHTGLPTRNPHTSTRPQAQLNPAPNPFIAPDTFTIDTTLSHPGTTAPLRTDSESSPTHTQAPAISPTPPPPDPETRRYQPEKGIDEKYFRNLRRF